MKIVLLLSLLGVTVVSGVFLDDGYGGRRSPYHHRHSHSYETSDSSSSDSCERPRHRHRTTVKPTPPCPSDWLTFDRPQGRWCVKVFIGNINWFLSQAKCQELGATLTGVQNDTERMAVANMGRRIQQLNNLGLTTIWLGVKRKPACPRANICRPEDTFEWTDGFTTGTAGFHFSISNPNGQSNGNEIQSCIDQFIYPYTDTWPGWDGYRHGDFDDNFCSMSLGGSTFYACGRRP